LGSNRRRAIGITIEEQAASAALIVLVLIVLDCRP
jgi:hypothetical protein